MACAKSSPPGQGRMPISDWLASGMGAVEPGDRAAQALVEAEPGLPPQDPRRFRDVEAAMTDVPRSGPPAGVFQLLPHDPADRGEQLARTNVTGGGDIHRLSGSLLQGEKVRSGNVFHVDVVPRHAFRLFGKG